MEIVCCGNPLQGMVHDGESKTPARKMHQSPLDSTGCVKARGSAFDVAPFVGFPGPLPSMATYIQLQPQSSNSWGSPSCCGVGEWLPPSAVSWRRFSPEQHMMLRESACRGLTSSKEHGENKWMSVALPPPPRVAPPCSRCSLQTSRASVCLCLPPWVL